MPGAFDAEVGHLPLDDTRVAAVGARGQARRSDVGEDLITHELCHVWQMQHKPFAMPLSYLYRGYGRNPYELEARRAVVATEPARRGRTSPAS